MAKGSREPGLGGIHWGERGWFHTRQLPDFWSVAKGKPPGCQLVAFWAAAAVTICLSSGHEDTQCFPRHPATSGFYWLPAFHDKWGNSVYPTF